MNTIAKEITGQTIANQVRMERAIHKGSFLLLEGHQDANVFAKFHFEGLCAIVVCSGRENLLDSISILAEQGVSGCLGFADSDYSAILGPPECNGPVVFTSENDMEIMILCTDALTNTVREFGHIEKLNAAAHAKDVEPCQLIFELAAPLGVLRILSQRDGWNLRFHGMKYKYLDKNSPKIDLAATVRHLVGRSDHIDRPEADDIVAAVGEYLAGGTSLRALCNGYDCVRILGRALRRRYGATNTFNSEETAESLAKSLRLAFEYRYFRATASYAGIRDWEHETGYAFLRDV